MNSLIRAIQQGLAAQKGIKAADKVTKTFGDQTRRAFLKKMGTAAAAAGLPKVPKNPLDYIPRKVTEEQFRRRVNMLPAGTKSVFQNPIGNAPVLNQDGQVFLGMTDYADELYFLSPQQINELKQQLVAAQKHADTLDAATKKALAEEGAVFDINTGKFHTEMQVEYRMPDGQLRYQRLVSEGDKPIYGPAREYTEVFDAEGNPADPDSIVDNYNLQAEEAGMQRAALEYGDGYQSALGANAPKMLQRDYNKEIGDYKRGLKQLSNEQLHAQKGTPDHLSKFNRKEKQARLDRGVRFGSNAPIDDAGDPRRAFKQESPLQEMVDPIERGNRLPIERPVRPSRYMNPLLTAPLLLQGLKDE